MRTSGRGKTLVDWGTAARFTTLTGAPTGIKEPRGAHRWVHRYSRGRFHVFRKMRVNADECCGDVEDVRQHLENSCQTKC